MAQLVTRVPDDLLAGIDRLVREGIVASRSEAVRAAVVDYLTTLERRRVGHEIVAGYRQLPQREEELAWSDAATVAMIADEPW